MWILLCAETSTWVVVQAMVPFWVPNIIRYLYIFGYPKRDHNFDNHPDVKRRRIRVYDFQPLKIVALIVSMEFGDSL